ncbi:MAG: glycine C-acetyltransferase [Spirochaetaceae bacterium]|nr:MAG: glycine C-acetyltransferase [Spirochaetaceae bacterium]
MEAEFSRIDADLARLKDNGLYKRERIITGPQDAHISVEDGRTVINLCANNYLGLAAHPEVIAAAHEALDRWGYGLSSVRFICGTQEIHRRLEQELAEFLGTEDAILYASCFDANGGLFETLLGPEDAVISDSLNHASIIDGIRLCKARRHLYRNADMNELEERLRETQDARVRLIATDGVFSMDGTIAPLDKICDLAERYDALVMIDDCHAVGFLGEGGRGTHEYRGVIDRVDIITGTLGKALGGASGGYTAARRSVVEMLRQRSRPYLFSNSVAPPIVGASLAALDLVRRDTTLRTRLFENTAWFRSALAAAGLTVPEGTHPIVPIMLGEAQIAQTMATRLLEHGIYAVGFFFPVVPQGTARIRTQVSAAHSREDLERAVTAFAEVARDLGVLA